jgi:hypothetical protein
VISALSPPKKRSGVEKGKALDYTKYRSAISFKIIVGSII